MSDKVHGGNGVKAGQTSVSIPFRLLSTAGAAVTGKAAADLTAHYWRQGGSPTSISLSDLAAINSAYSSGGVKQADATNMPGLYRIDVPDAAFATGADWVAIAIVCSGAMDYEVFIPLESVGNSETYARLGAPAGASLAADVAGIPAAVWAVGTRTLTSFGTLVADIWASVTRTLTSGGGATAQQVWEYATRTITGGGGSAADIWAYATRTLTQTLTVVPGVSGSEITAYRGTTWSVTLTVGALTGNSKVWFTVKDDLTKADSAAYLQVESTAGLVRFNGDAASAGDATLVVDDEATGTITLTVQESVTQNAPLRRGLVWDLKALMGGTVSIKARGTLDVVADVTRAIS